MSVEFTDIIRKFEAKGEKTGWSYLHIPADMAAQLKPDNRRSFRVKGSIDALEISQIALLPMGEGDFIMPINGDMRKSLGKKEGAMVSVVLEEDTSERTLDPELLECLEADPDCLAFFQGMTRSHQSYYSNWVSSAKTIETKTKRIVATMEAMRNGWDYGQMMRELRDRRSQG